MSEELRLRIVSGIVMAAVVLVATARALKMNGGVAKKDLSEPNVDAVRAGSVNLKRHIENVKKFGITPKLHGQLRKRFQKGFEAG